MKIANPKFTLERVKAAFDYYAKKGVAPMNGILRVETPLQAGKGRYDFNLKKDQSLLTPAERSMDQWDIFIVTHLFLGLRVDADAKPGFAPILTYPFVGNASITNIEGFKTADITALYNGTLSIMTNNVENMANFPLSRFLHVPETQPDTNSVTLPQIDMSDVMVQTPEQIVFAGTTKHKIEIEFPYTAASDFAPLAASGYTSKLVFEAYGYNIKGGASEEFKEAANPLNGRF